MPAVYSAYISLWGAHFPSREFSKVSINQLKCVYSSKDSPPMSRVAGFSCCLRLEKNSIHIFSQLGRSPSMALFKSKVHNDRISPTLNYPDFLNWQTESEGASSAGEKKKREREAQIRRGSGWCLQWSFTREEDADKDQVLRLKGSEGVQRMKVPSSSQHAAIGSWEGLQSSLKSQRAPDFMRQ